MKLSPSVLASKFVNKDNIFTRDVLTILKTSCKYIALELFYHPSIKAYIRKRAFHHALISTKPTEKGNSTINIYTEHYRVKRIKNYPIREMNDDIFLEILDCEK
jgi:transcriptional accessory protein Tex/SPT6